MLRCDSFISNIFLREALEKKKEKQDINIYIYIFSLLKLQ